MQPYLHEKRRTSTRGPERRQAGRGFPILIAPFGSVADKTKTLHEGCMGAIITTYFLENGASFIVFDDPDETYWSEQPCRNRLQLIQVLSLEANPVTQVEQPVIRQ